jgi:hypothetical protein
LGNWPEENPNEDTAAHSHSSAGNPAWPAGVCEEIQGRREEPHNGCIEEKTKEAKEAKEECLGSAQASFAC